MPYLVTTHSSLRSLRTRIDKNGALNTFTVGRYLDQIATALEYAHEHGVLHGDLSVDTIFIRLDGQLVVADVGVRSLLEMDGLDKPRNQPLVWGEGYAPEQLLGKLSHPSTDVYALGAVIYHLLTGSPVFAGTRRDDIAQQHLTASIPSLTQHSDLSVDLYDTLARAMAKDPAQRFQQAGAFANAYHSAIGQTNSSRVPFTALLLGLMQQTHLLDNQAVVLQTVASNRNTSMIVCVAQSMLDIIEGVHGLHYHPLSDTCMDQGVIAYGDGYGLSGKGYLSTAEKHAALALSQPDATNAMHQHAALMNIALTNITGWVATMEQDLLHLRDHPTDLSPLQEVTTLADNAYRGVDANWNGQIEPVVGEAGALVAFQQGQLMATLTLAPAA